MRKLVFLMVAAGGLIAGCKKSSPPSDSPAQPAPAPVASAAAADKEDDAILAKLKSPSTTLAEAASLVKQDIEQDRSGSHNLAARRLAFWAAGHLKWDEVSVAKNEISARLIIKDPEASAGKRLCVRGDIIEIHKHQIEDQKMFWGLLGTYGDDFVSFWAIGDTGELVAGRSARFCGAAAGKFVYDTRAKSENEAVEIVGVFDLPSNRPAPQQITADVRPTTK